MTEANLFAGEPAGEQKIIRGPAFRGVSVSVRASKAKYSRGEPIPLTLTIYNAGRQEVRLVVADRMATYRLIAFDASGTAVAKSDLVVAAEESTATPGIITRSVTVVPSGEKTQENVEAAQFLKFNQKGVYNVIVTRKILTWEEGFLVSNPIRVEVVD